MLLKIKRAAVEDHYLTLGARVKYPYRPGIYSPKITVIFSDGEQDRYLPLEVKSYYQNKDLESCTIIAEYKFDIDCIFSHPVKNENVTLSFSLQYGEDLIDDIPCVFDTDTAKGADYDIGMTDGVLTLRRSAPYIEKRLPLLLRVIRGFFSVIYKAVVRLIGYAFLPLFFLDACLSYIGLKEGYFDRSKRTLYRFFADHVRLCFRGLTRENIGRGNLDQAFVSVIYFFARMRKIKDDRVTFLSNRRGDLSGNFEYIYDVLKDDKTLDLRQVLDPAPLNQMHIRSLFDFAVYYATSKVVIVDDYYELTSKIEKRPGVRLIQVWHACGAFKTFGFSRLGKPGGPRQTSINHRMYDKAIVSSSEIRRFYAEGFGIPLSHVAATGVPRTDIFFDEDYKKKMQNDFYEKYPALKDKKIILFAPTFRGNGRLTGYYPMEKFPASDVLDELGPDWAVLIKLHPFCNTAPEIPKGYEDRIIDFTSYPELNDLLFVTDLLISDYSSVIFEASLLDIPMLFYAYDLSEYIATRDFYYEYETFLPGKLVTTLTDLITAIENNDFQSEKIQKFKYRFFDDHDGKSAQRVASLIIDELKS